MSQSDSDLVAYAGRFWDAGNSVVILMFAVGFGIFVLLAQSLEARRIAADWAPYLMSIGLAGNCALAVMIFRLGIFEARILTEAGASTVLLDASWSAVEWRLGLLTGNILVFVFAIEMVRRYTAKPTSIPL